MEDDPMCVTSPVQQQATGTAGSTISPQQVITPMPMCTPWLANLNHNPYHVPSVLHLRGLRKVLFATSLPALDPPLWRTVLPGNTDEKYKTGIPMLYEV